MGSIQRIKGKECEHSWNCKIGSGILHSSLARVAEEYPQETAEKILQYEQKKQPVLFDFQYQLALCRHCKAIQSVPVFTILENHEAIIGLCKECGEQVDLIEDIGNTCCPVCQKRGFSSEEIGRWD